MSQLMTAVLEASRAYYTALKAGDTLGEVAGLRTAFLQAQADYDENVELAAAELHANPTETPKAFAQARGVNVAHVMQRYHGE